MRLTGIGDGVKNQINEKSTNNIRGYLIEGVLIQREEALFLKTSIGELPVRWLGTQAPLSERLLFNIVGRDDKSLFLSLVSQNEVERLEVLIREWGFDTSFPWRIIVGELVREEMPITRENLSSLKQSLLLAQEEWGVVVHPRIFVYLLARNLPIKPYTVLWALYRLYPDLRGDLPAQFSRRRSFQADLLDTENFETILKGMGGSNTDSAMPIEPIYVQGALYTKEIWEFPDGGQIHWHHSSKKRDKVDNGFRFELIPPNLGLIEVLGKKDGTAYQISLTVDSHLVREFGEELPHWQVELERQGYQVILSIESAQSFTPKLPMKIDRRV
jgi:hypothetical protein